MDWLNPTLIIPEYPSFVNCSADAALGVNCSLLKIPIKAKHQMKNTSDVDLVFIEVQLGTYFGEDDIVRLEDSYGRV